MAWIEQHHGAYRITWRDEQGHKNAPAPTIPNARRRRSGQGRHRAQGIPQTTHPPHRLGSPPARPDLADWLNSLPIAPITKASYERSNLPRLPRILQRTLHLNHHAPGHRRLLHPPTNAGPGLHTGTRLLDHQSLLRMPDGRTPPAHNPARKVRIPRVHKSPELCLSFEQERRLLAAITERQRVKFCSPETQDSAPQTSATSAATPSTSPTRPSHSTSSKNASGRSRKPRPAPFH